jgi:hypothetical protein
MDPATATASHSCASARALHARACALPRASRQGSARRRRAHVHGRGPPAHGRSLGRRHHRPAQPRHDQHRRHASPRARSSCSPASRTSRRRCSAASVLRDPLRMKALQKGLDQLCEEGATQVFRPLRNNDLILGAVGLLQFDVVAFRLQDEYGVQAGFDNVNVHTARWVYCADARKLQEFRDKALRQPGARPFWRAGLPGAHARQPAAHAGALAGARVPRDARAPGQRGLSGRRTQGEGR